MREKNLFCAREQAITVHTWKVVNKELIATCGCGDFIKFPADATKETLVALIEAHEAANKGQVSADSIPDPALHPVLSILDSI